MERVTRFELATYALARRRSTAELNPHDGKGTWWGEVDSNHRSRQTTDLQSAPFGHLGIPPNRWWLRPESNRRHVDFQSTALPTELPSHLTYAVSGDLVAASGLEPPTLRV
jgi:hypothetical protein